MRRVDTPNEGVEKTDVSITDISGTGFQSGATVTLSNASASATATNLQIVSATRISCTVNVPAGVYDVTVQNPDGQQARWQAPFSPLPPAARAPAG